MFYLDAHIMDNAPNGIYSTLAHEFNHMINYNVKGTINEAWYTEMLSMLAEDLLCPLIGIPITNTAHPAVSRGNYFLAGYFTQGPYYWSDASDSVYFSYANNYAFGAYLARNFGGAELVSAIAKSPIDGKLSINTALVAQTGGDIDLNKALARYFEAFVFSGTLPARALSFDKTVTKAIAGIDYTFYGFNVNTAGRIRITNMDTTLYPKGPFYFAADQMLTSFPGNTFTLHSDSAWNGKTGSLDIALQKPASDYVKMYLVRRNHVQ
jgi:hypothetical protein